MSGIPNVHLRLMPKDTWYVKVGEYTPFDQPVAREVRLTQVEGGNLVSVLHRGTLYFWWAGPATQNDRDAWMALTGQTIPLA